MLHVFAKIKVNQGQESALHAALKDLCAASRAEEGCIAYDAFVSRNDPTVVRIKECWKSGAALQEHMGMPHFLKFGGEFAEHFAEPLEVDLVEEIA